MIPACFDTYQSVLISPDHVLYGNSENVLEACLVCLTSEDRAKFEDIMLDILRRNGMNVGNKILSTSSNMKVATKSITDIYTIMFVAPSAFDLIFKTKQNESDIDESRVRYVKCLKEVGEILNLLYEIICLVQWNPCPIVDTKTDIEEYEGEGGFARLKKIRD